MRCTVILVVLLCAACRGQDDTLDYVARVGNAFLTPDDVAAALGGFYGGVDSAGAKSQIIEQWVEKELLYQEAIRQNLASEALVKQQLEDAKRAVLIDALVTLLYEETTNSITEADLSAYYETYKERLRILEPFVLVRYIDSHQRDTALAVMQEMRGREGNEAAQLFDSLALAHALDPSLSLSMASNYWPESRLFAGQPAVRQHMLSLAPASAGRVYSVDSLHFYLQIVDRVPAGTVPELAWIEDQVRIHSAIQHRKQRYEQMVQRLRTEALARDMLVLKR